MSSTRLACARRVVPIAVLLLLLSARPILAQYIYLDTDGDGLHGSADLVQQSGVTTLDVYLRTNTNRDGSMILCPVDYSVPNTISSYMVTIQAENGTVAWGSWINLMPFGTQLFNQASPTEMTAGWAGSSALPPGTYRLGQVTLTVTSGVPHLIFGMGDGLDSGSTYFQSSCYGSNFDNYMRLGADWVGADGVGNSANQPAALSPIADIVMEENEVIARTITATDPEGEPVQFTMPYGPQYMFVTTDGTSSGVTTGTIRTSAYSYAGMDTAAVMASDGFASVSDTFLIVVRPRFSIKSLSGAYDMRVAAGETATQIITATDSDGDASEITFEILDGPTYASIRSLPLLTPATAQCEILLAPGLADVGTSSLRFRASKGLIHAEDSVDITVDERANQGPWVSALPDLHLHPNTSKYIWLIAYDPDGDFLTARKLAGPDWVYVSAYGEGGMIGGAIYFSPTWFDLGTAQVEIGVSDGSVEWRESFAVTVSPDPAPPNGAPIADAGGPYSALVGEPIMFNGLRSVDPDGDFLRWRWSFGDGATSGGYRQTHAYAAPGAYTVVLVASDGVLSGSDSTVATIRPIATEILEARAFLEESGRIVPLHSQSSGSLSVLLEPVNGDFVSQDVDLGSVVMRSDSTGVVNEIHAAQGKEGLVTDLDHNGVAEVLLRFRYDGLASLLSRIQARKSVTVLIKGTLQSGARIEAPLVLNVMGLRIRESARVHPNPMNPSATLTVTTSLDGALDVRLYDVNGRLVRVLAPASWVPAGLHDVSIDGKGSRGESLASGIYYYRVKSAQGVLTGRVTIAR